MSTNPLPEWLTAAPPEPTPSVDPALRDTQYGILFEHLLDRVTVGESLASVLRNDVRQIDQAAFMRYVKRNAERMQRLREAQEIHAEVIASEIQDLADDATELDSRVVEIKINARKWTAGINDRKRFGERKEIEINQNIDIRGALADARQRVIEGAFEVIEDDSSSAK